MMFVGVTFQEIDQEHCSFKLVLTTMMIINIYGTK